MKDKSSDKSQDISPIILLLMVMAFLVFSCILTWGISPVSAEGPISAPLHAATQANYAVEGDNEIPRIDEKIIREVILDRNPYATAMIVDRIATLNANLLTSVPTMTLSLKDQIAATNVFLDLPTARVTQLPTEIVSPEPSPYLSPAPSSTAVPAALPTVSLPTLPPVFLPTPTSAPPPPSPGIEIVKKLASYEDNDSSGSITFGDHLWYRFTVSNIGDTVLEQVYVEEVSFDLPVTCPGTSLPEGQSITCTADTFHVVTAEEANSGEVVNNAFAYGTYDGVQYKDKGQLALTVEQNQDIQIQKQLLSYDDHDSSGDITQGDGLWYQFEVSNTGNVTLSNISVVDNTFAILVTCPSTTLAPLMNMTCVASSSHIVTPAEALAGQVVNTATAGGEFNGTTCSVSDTLTTVVLPTMGLADISGQVRDDANGNGVLDGSEVGISNVVIQLSDGVCALGVNCPNTQTGLDGAFTFSGVPDGSYTLFATDLAQYISIADSEPPNDNQINVTISGGVGSTDNVFLDMADPAFCSDPDSVTGFVLSSDPADGETGVPLSTTTLSVTFINPMLTAGGGNVLDPGNYYNDIDNMTLGGSISITGTRYEAGTKTVFLTIDTGDPDWQSGCEYRVQVKSPIRNACQVMQNIDVEVFFTTE